MERALEVLAEENNCSVPEQETHILTAHKAIAVEFDTRFVDQQ